jgi:predicted GIY-YIG superfamily endonuclease
VKPAESAYRQRVGLNATLQSLTSTAFYGRWLRVFIMARHLDSVGLMPPPRRFVYILKSLTHPDEYYVGVTSDPGVRLQAHNAGLSSSTAKHRPWRILVRVEFDDEAPALEFERYLKSGSGREFARRHFRQTVRSAKRPKGEGGPHPANS